MAAEGEIIFYDVIDPGAPQEIHRKSISGTDKFSVDLKEEDIKSGLIRVVFEPAPDTDPSKSREFLTVASSKMTATMSNDESIKSEILLYQLNLESGNALLDLGLIKERFNELKTTINLDEEVNRFGHPDALNLLLSEADSRGEMIELIASARISSASKKFSLIDLQSQFYTAAQKKSLIKDEIILNCDHNGASLYLSDIDEKRNFFMEADAVELGLIEMFGPDLNKEKKSLS
jgi:hypothetical protein